MKKFGWMIVVVMLLLLCSCGHTHEYTDTVVPATCAVDGYTEHVCECGESYRDNVTTMEHQGEIIPYQLATCTQEGLTQGKKCSVCGEILTAQESVPALGHDYGEAVVVREPTASEVGLKEKECSVCGEIATEEIPMLEIADVVFDLNGADVPYATWEQLGDAFLADYVSYSEASATKEAFQTDSTASVKVALADAQMLEKWEWLWVYMLAHLQMENVDQSSAYIVDTYPVLEKIIQGDTAAILESPNARTSIRSYLHGMLNSMKGCGELNTTFAVFSPDFSVEQVRENLMKGTIAVTLDKGEELFVPVRAGYTFGGWKNADGEIVTTVTASGTLTAVWEPAS